jgi:adenosylcobinamide-phosphate synthase
MPMRRPSARRPQPLRFASGRVCYAPSLPPFRATSWQLLTGLALDLLLGDPRWLPHPVAGFGRAAQVLERLFYRPRRLAGAVYCAAAVVLAAGVAWASVFWLPQPWTNIYWVFSLLALRGLDRESWRVLQTLEAEGLAAARTALGRIVGRDTAELDETGVMRAALETVAENLNDAVVAPLFYLALAGPVGMAVYKAVNTLDSMVGYRHELYREFGWASARLDDAANYIPARLSAGLVWAAALLLGKDFRQSIRVTLRDARRQPSPNSGFPEAAFAGALGVQLGGLNFYGGVASRKEYLGDPLRPLDGEAFRGARQLLYAAGGLAAGAAALWLPWEWV